MAMWSSPSFLLLVLGDGFLAFTIFVVHSDEPSSPAPAARLHPPRPVAAATKPDATSEAACYQHGRGHGWHISQALRVEHRAFLTPS